MDRYREGRSFVVAAALALIAALPAQAGAAPVATLDELTLEADLIVVGSTARISPLDAASVVEVEATRTIKGAVDGNKVFYLAPPARPGGPETAVVGETALLFLKKAAPPPGFTLQIKGIVGESQFMNLVRHAGRLPAVGTAGGEEILAVKKDLIAFPAALDTTDWSSSKASASTTHCALKPTMEHIQRVLQAAAKGPASAPEATARKFGLHHTVEWGHGCSGRCAISREGASDVTVVFLQKSAIRVTDAGKLSGATDGPGGRDDEAKRWDLAFRGTWYLESTAAAVMDLVVESENCSETLRKGGVSDLKCGKVPPRLKVSCSLEQVPAFPKKPSGTEKSAGTPTAAWICNPGKGAAAYPGTQFPWVFGATSRLSTMVTGDRRPEAFYISVPGSAK